MNRRQLFFLAVPVLLMASSAIAAEIEIAGTWLSTIPYPGKAIQQSFNFEVSGQKLTGKVTLPYGTFDITDGKVNGDEISFSATLDNNGVKTKHTYTGKVLAMSESGLRNKEMRIVDAQDGSTTKMEYPAHKAESRMGGGVQGGAPAGAPPQQGSAPPNR